MFLDQQIVEFLVARRKLTGKQAGQLLAAAEGRSLELILVERGMLDKHSLLQIKSLLTELRAVDLAAVPIDLQTVKLLPGSMSRKFAAVVYGIEDERLLIASANPTDPFARYYISMRTNREIDIRVAYYGDVQALQDRAYPSEETEPVGGVLPPAPMGRKGPGVIAEAEATSGQRRVRLSQDGTEEPLQLPEPTADRPLTRPARPRPVAPPPVAAAVEPVAVVETPAIRPVTLGRGRSSQLPMTPDESQPIGLEAAREADRLLAEEDAEAEAEADRLAMQQLEAERLEEERRQREAAERKAREEAERQAREAAERQAREAAARRQREEAEQKAREEAERRARESAARRPPPPLLTAGPAETGKLPTLTDAQRQAQARMQGPSETGRLQGLPMDLPSGELRRPSGVESGEVKRASGSLPAPERAVRRSLELPMGASGERKAETSVPSVSVPPPPPLPPQAVRHEVTVGSGLNLLDTLSTMARNIAESGRLSYVVPQVLHTARLMTGADATAFLICEPDRRYISYYATDGGGSDAPQFAVPYDDTTLAGFCVVRGQALSVSSLRNESRFSIRAEQQAGMPCGATVCVPVRWGTDVVGVLVAARHGDGELDARPLLMVAAPLGAAVRARQMETSMHDIRMETVQALLDWNEAGSPGAQQHATDVAQLARDMAREMVMPPSDVEELSFAALLHDIGLLPDRSRDDRQHPGRGSQILQKVTILQKIIPLVRYHHERYDGQGYPSGARGTDIPLGARILAVAEAYVEAGLHKVDRNDAALKAFLGRFGTEFDPGLQKAFAQSVNLAI